MESPSQVLPQVGAKRAPDFPAAPASWYYLATIAELARKPVGITLPGGHIYVGFRTQTGKLAVVSGRCAHMGVDLSQGYVKGERLVCPLHGWEYGCSGHCEHIPAAETIPGFARQASFPVEECCGHVFFFNRTQARFPFPFFEGITPRETIASRRFEFIVDAPWHHISANAFDVQHFRNTHDRALETEPVVDCPHPCARRMVTDFRITGDSIYDRLTKRFSGASVKLTAMVWSGNIVMGIARFKRTTSYGLLSLVPVHETRTWVRGVVWVRRSQNPPAQWFADPVNAEIRRFFIRKFFESDSTRLAGVNFNPNRAIDADKELVDYFDWLHNLPQ